MSTKNEPGEPSVLFITRKWPPAIGGMETYAVELTRELAPSLTLDVRALPGRPDGSPPSAASLMSFALGSLPHYWRRSAPPDILHLCDMASWPLAVIAWTRSRRPALVLSAHGTDVSYHRRGGLKGTLYGAYLRIGARLLRNAKVVANSAATASAAAETGWRTAAIVPLATAIPAKEPPASAHGRHLLFAGRLVERKGCRWFVENVLPLLPPEIHLHVAGTTWDKSEAAALDDPRVTYMGPLKGEDLLASYRSALCVIVPNVELPSGEFEGFGLVAAEAAAAGGVVLAADCGGLREAVIDGETGFLVPAGAAEAWRQRIEDVAGWSATEREAFTDQATARARDHYNWQRVARQVMEVYEVTASMQRWRAGAAENA